ncbi:MAG: hypothetical protein GY795_12535 [Desulfobacterales bacterium]|nr:hypothetical protein [Desulfobacterales bacterium]
MKFWQPGSVPKFHFGTPYYYRLPFIFTNSEKTCPNIFTCNCITILQIFSVGYYAQINYGG